jgi:hypothetical protein
MRIVKTLKRRGLEAGKELSFRAKSRIEQLGKLRHRRDGRGLSEREVSESNPGALL